MFDLQFPIPHGDGRFKLFLATLTFAVCAYRPHSSGCCHERFIDVQTVCLLMIKEHQEKKTTHRTEQRYSLEIGTLKIPQNNSFVF